MSEYRTNNPNAVVNATPLFASTWLALFSVLRDNYFEAREITGLDECLPLPEPEKGEAAISD